MLDRDANYKTADGRRARILNMQVSSPDGPKVIALVNEQEYVMYNDDGTPYTLGPEYALTKITQRVEGWAWVKSIDYKTKRVEFDRYYAARNTAENHRPGPNAVLAHIILEE